MSSVCYHVGQHRVAKFQDTNWNFVEMTQCKYSSSRISIAINCKKNSNILRGSKKKTESGINGNRIFLNKKNNPLFHGYQKAVAILTE